MSNTDLYTRYTITLKDLLDREPTFLDNIFVFSKEEQSNKFKKVFVGMYWNYEICGETINEFRLMLEGIFKTKVDYYQEMLDAYETQINMLDGVKSNALVENIDLPNKKTDKEYISSKVKTTTSGGINVIELKKQYLNLLRNLYEDFSKDFMNCFIQWYY